ncbi:MAG: hypothetical protein JWQ76_2849 [Ramlibacter sp.]|nr:hypothetical protein [Ramlibacter sp.]
MSEKYEKPRLAGLLAVALATALAAGAAQAAGGHHDVDDANLLARGECTQESWLVYPSGGSPRLHAGVNCRVGPVELGLAGEHLRPGGQPSETFWVLEAKWARELAEGFSVGLDVQPVFQANARPHYAGLTAYAIASWTPRPGLALHANYGRDFIPGAAGQARGGVAAEWQASQRWSFVAERYRDQATQFGRAGARWAGGRAWSVDFSRAQRLAGPAPSKWTVGLSFDFPDD